METLQIHSWLQSAIQDKPSIIQISFWIPLIQHFLLLSLAMYLTREKWTIMSWPIKMVIQGAPDCTQSLQQCSQQTPGVCTQWNSMNAWWPTHLPEEQNGIRWNNSRIQWRGRICVLTESVSTVDIWTGKDLVTGSFTFILQKKNLRTGKVKWLTQSPKAKYQQCFLTCLTGRSQVLESGRLGSWLCQWLDL